MWLVFLLQVFLVSVEQCESWLSNKEAFLSNQDPGVRTSSVSGFICQQSALI